MIREPLQRARTAMLWASVGAALTLLAVVSWDEGGDAPDIVRRKSETASSSAPASPTERAGTAAPSREALEAGEQRSAVPAIATPSAGAPAPAPTRARDPIVTDAPPSNSPLTPTDLPNRRSDDPSGASPAASLLDSPQISCDFAAGNNTGLRFGELLTVGGGAQWNGDPILFDLMDASAGTARMIGSPAATGSPNGEADVQVTTEGTRVFLSGFLENSGFVMITIYDELDNVGRHIAVMSRHESTFSYASQFLGTCE